jgi:hypothetical protein
VLFYVEALPEKAIEASAEFHARILPQVLEKLAEGPAQFVLVFPPADVTHKAWRLAAVQGLAREHAPLRVNALASDEDKAIAAAARYLEGAEGVTGHLLLLDGNGAGEVLSFAG